MIHAGCDQQRLLVLSLRPRFAHAILDGEKTVELRRVRPRVVVPTTALIYSASPEMSLVGAVRVDEVLPMRLDELWTRFGERTAVTRAEFDSYFVGREAGVALLLSSPRRLTTRVDLSELRNVERFRPPQSFSYLDATQGRRILALSDSGSADLPPSHGLSHESQPTLWDSAH